MSHSDERVYRSRTHAFLLHSLAVAAFPVSSTVNGSLTDGSAQFVRPYGYGTGYYYHAYIITVSTAGTYSFTTDSSIDTYGLLYDGTFDPSNPASSLLISNDDGGISLQFKITTPLESSRTYTLIVTTHGSFVIGSYSLIASGPVQLSLVMFLPSTIRPPPTTSKSYRESSSTRRLLYLLLDSMEYMIWFHSDFRRTYFRSFGELRWTVERYQSCVHST